MRTNTRRLIEWNRALQGGRLAGPSPPPGPAQPPLFNCRTGHAIADRQRYKYGWTSGAGLDATNTGTKQCRHQPPAARGRRKALQALAPATVSRPLTRLSGSLHLLLTISVSHAGAATAQRSTERDARPPATV